jgi:hypothetical protein
MDTDNPPPRRGRPPLDPAKRLVQRSIRLSAADWEKLDALGGAEWLRAALRRATVTPHHAPRRVVSPRARRLAALFVLDPRD